MRKLLIAAILIFSTPLLFAETLTPDMVKQIHDQVKNSFFEGCSKDLKGNAVDICRCLADKAQTNLNDPKLSQCNNDESGKDCVVKAVTEATKKATTNDNVIECKKKVEAAGDQPTGTTTDTPSGANSGANKAPTAQQQKSPSLGSVPTTNTHQLT